MEADYDTVKSLPKVELHCHLDGSVSPAALKTAAEQDGVSFPVDLQKFTSMIHAPAQCGSLKDYLDCFGIILPYLQSENALSLASFDLIRQAAAENVVYMEVRFAPSSCRRKGLSLEEAVRSVLSGLEQGEKIYGVKSRALLCLMRGDTEENNRLVVETARKMRLQGVAGIDLAGSEADYPPEYYRSPVRLALDYGLNLTIHAGECGSAKNVETSVQMGARRIGHGIALQKDAAIRKKCAEANILLEMCPVSNFQTKAATDWAAYPFELFWKEHMPISINTDNRTVSGTTLTEEYMLLSQKYPFFNYKMMLQLNLTALEHAFLPDDEKGELAKKIEEAYQAVLGRTE